MSITELQQKGFGSHGGKQTTIDYDITPLKKRVLVSDMQFGETKSKGGIILIDDDGSESGIHPRWAKVYAKGPTNNDDYNNGDWILVEHGRWTRGVKINNGNEEIELRMVEAESILAFQDEQPNDVYMSE
mgnify:CR=1 FL=1